MAMSPGRLLRTFGTGVFLAFLVTGNAGAMILQGAPGGPGPPGSGTGDGMITDIVHYSGGGAGALALPAPDPVIAPLAPDPLPGVDDAAVFDTTGPLPGGSAGGAPDGFIAADTPVGQATAPEPAALGLLGLGLVVCALGARRRSRTSPTTPR